MQVRFGELARLEFRQARRQYEKERTGLGLQFAQEVRSASTRLARLPLLCALEIGEVRKCNLNRFPYSLRYVLRGDVVVIVAVSHQHRAPDYWIDRLRRI